jgi:hypothetical protein
MIHGDKGTLYDENALSGLRNAIDTFSLKDIDLSDETIERSKESVRGELYLTRAQLKMLSSDYTALDDLLLAQRLLPGETRVKSIYATMLRSESTGGVAIPLRQGLFKRFTDILDPAQKILAAYTGSCGENICNLVKGEILYFSGKFDEAVAVLLTALQYFRRQNQPIRIMQCDYHLLCCYLAQGKPEYASHVIFDLIHWSKRGSAEQTLYKTIRLWLNITTGWSGDTPRYYVVPDGTVIPLLQDRADAVRQGIAEHSGRETFLLELSRRWGQPKISLRELYMMLYTALVAFNDSAASLPRLNLPEIFTISRDVGFVQHITEYGRQIVPLLKAASQHNLFDRAYLSELILRANQYEKCICLFRDEQ